jgi:hypothetical protein
VEKYEPIKGGWMDGLLQLRREEEWIAFAKNLKSGMKDLESWKNFSLLRSWTGT